MNKLATLSLLHQHQTEYAEEAAFLAHTLAFVQSHDDFWQRSNLAGHLTGSAWVLSPDQKAVLLIHHAKLDKWFQPGGHADDTDETLADTARREAMEECGLAELSLVSPLVFDLDVHEIPMRGQEPAHLHYDVRFLFQAPDDLVQRQAVSEIKDLAWVDWQTLCTADTPQSLRRMALKLRKAG